MVRFILGMLAGIDVFFLVSIHSRFNQQHDPKSKVRGFVSDRLYSYVSQPWTAYTVHTFMIAITVPGVIMAYQFLLFRLETPYGVANTFYDAHCIAHKCHYTTLRQQWKKLGLLARLLVTFSLVFFFRFAFSLNLCFCFSSVLIFK